MNPGLIQAMTQQMIGPVASAAAYYMPNKFERQYRKQMAEELDATAEGRGGMSGAQYQRELSKAQGNIAAQTQQQLAQVQRGYGSAATSGQAGQAQANVYRAAQQAGIAAQGQLRAHDMALAQQRRQAAIQGLMNAANMEYSRRQQALGQLGKMDTSAMWEAGQKRAVSEGVAGQEAAAAAAGSI